MDGAKPVRLFDEDIAVRARIYSIAGFSAHADQKGLLAWRNAISRVKTTFLVHGVTGSGKTEVYLQALAATIALGR